ncbi:MAG: TraR/DksA family transcriptional regulator [Actinobacteria bacterium]|nr:MAG: TraR/DksA family transcriptional regulator [Actinomycetota bacterium]REK33885.1 MAG: TraR/DksA family transcriptional regulator [Actinomycetota bacterium]
MSTIDTSQAKASLLEERAHLVHQLEELGAAESGDLRSDLDFGDSFADAGSVTAERTEVLGLVDSIKGQLDDVDAALAQIESGKYGTCNNCGKDIPAARLEARPSSILCVDCKSASR